MTWRESPQPLLPSYNFAETFIVPAACEAYRLSPLGSESVTVIRANLRAEWFQRQESQWLTPD